MDDYKWYPDDYQSKPEPAPVQNNALVVSAIPQKKPKSRLWLVILSTALATSILCTGAFTALLYSPILKDQIISSDSTIIYRDGSDQRPKVDVSTVLNTTNTSAEGSAPMSVIEIARQVGPAVVGIVCEGQTNAGMFFVPSTTTSSGSGIIISGDGYILTNAHVIEGANKIKVILSTQAEYAATVVGKDTKTDLAVIKIDAKDLPTAVLGNSSDVQVGELSVAIGNPLGQELAGSVTTGCISAVNRTVTVDGKEYTLIQTDAAINPGNSGGALVNAYGEVIGINSVKMSSTGVEGIGFAIPSDVAKPIISDLISVGYVQGRPLIGINGRNVTADLAQYYNLPEGVYVRSLTEFSGAELAGIKPGDVIIKCDGKDIKTMSELNAIRDTHKAGEQIVLTVSRSGQTLDITVTLTEEKPEPPSESSDDPGAGTNPTYPINPFNW